MKRTPECATSSSPVRECTPKLRAQGDWASDGRLEFVTDAQCQVRLVNPTGASLKGLRVRSRQSGAEVDDVKHDWG